MQARPVLVFHQHTKIILRSAIVISAFALCNCSQKFRPLRPERLYYSDAQDAGDSVFVSYRMDLQELAGNRTFSSNEYCRHVMVVGIKVENESSHPIRLTPLNFGIYGNGDREKIVYSPKKYCHMIRQPALLYAFDGYLVFGIIDAMIAAKANREHLLYEHENKIWNREVLPGESIYGLVALNAHDEEDLGFYFNRQLKPVVSEVEIKGSYHPPTDTNSDKESDYYVVFKNGSALKVHARIQALGCEEFMVYPMEGKLQRIHPSDTKFVVLIQDHRRIAGIPTDGCWIFKVISGSISAYNYSGDEKSVVYIQKLDGPLVPFNPELLTAMTDQIERVGSYIYQQRYWKAILEYDEQF
jgi:hypothetical protein